MEPQRLYCNDKELVHLQRVFGHMPIDLIAPMHIREYLDIRGQAAKVRANREKALFSHMFNKAREWGHHRPEPLPGCQRLQGGRARQVCDQR